MPLPEYNPARSAAEARRRGLHKYATGKPCKYGHIGQRYTVSGACISCAKENSDKYEPPSVKPNVRKRIEELTQSNDFEESWE